MARLIYSTIASLDGYIEDRNGNFEWAAPDEAVHTFVNDLERTIGTYLYGRRMYETMVYWESPPVSDGSPVAWKFAEIWQGADKVVYSTTLDDVFSAKTRIERNFDPAQVHAMKAQASRDISVGGPNLAASAIRAGLVDDWQLFLIPIVIGGGKPALPHDVRVNLELLNQRRFDSGVVYLHYRTSARTTNG